MPLQKVLTAISGYALPSYTFTRSSSGYQVDADGVLRLKSTDQLRIDYLDLDNDGERETPSIVVELASTNEFTRSIEFSHSTWAKVAATVEANVGAAPDLSTQADLLVPSTASAQHYISQAGIGVAASTDHAFSVYASPAGYNFLALEVLNSSGNNGAAALFELTSSGAVADTLTIGAGTHRRSHIERVRPGAYRCTLTAGISTSTSATGYILVAQTSAQIASNWAGGGSSAGLGVLLWGAQLEEAMPAETSLIATSAATLSRAADTLYIPFPYTPREMTLYIKMVERGTAARAAGDSVIHIGSATGSAAPALDVYFPTGGAGYSVLYNGDADDTQATLAAAPSVGQIVELRSVFYANGGVLIGQSLDAAAETTASDAAGAAMAAAWAAERLYIMSAGATNQGMNRVLSVTVAEGVQSMAYMRSLAPFFVIDGIAIPVDDGSVREDRVEIGDRERTFDGTLRETIRSQVSVWQAETPPLTVGDRNRVAQALEKSTQPHTSYGAMTRTSTGLLPAVFSRKTGEALVQSSTDRRYSLAFTIEQSS